MPIIILNYLVSVFTGQYMDGHLVRLPAKSRIL